MTEQQPTPEPVPAHDDDAGEEVTAAAPAPATGTDPGHDLDPAGFEEEPDDAQDQA